MRSNFSSVTVAAVIVVVIGLVAIRVVVRRAFSRESREPGINQAYLPPARYHDNPSLTNMNIFTEPGETRDTIVVRRSV